jgi:NH3-dependent NAD+ synthetase
MDSTRLVTYLADVGRLAVAFSGGADSALVLAAAVRALGPADVLAVTANSASLAAVELAAARDVRVRDLGGTARIELDTTLAAGLHDDPRLLDAVRALGFTDATVSSFRSGALNHEPG